MEFQSGNPGAVQFGNFINYYDFHPAEERIRLLPSEHWRPALPDGENVNSKDKEEKKVYLVLDVGCNTGQLTQLLWQHLSATACRGQCVHVLGIDVDPVLIERAKEANQYPEYITFTNLDIMEKMTKDNVEQTSLPSTIAQFLHIHNRKRFDAVCCFSITMWIHLNYNDAGLQFFLRRIATWAELLVIEPQPWRCYQTAMRRMKRAGSNTFPLLSQLKWRLNVEQKIENYLADELHRCKIFESPQTHWKRKICFYR